MAKISEIKLPNNSIYQLKDSGALQLTGGTVTGPVNFEDSVYISDLNAGNLVVTGNAAFTNNIQANTINGVEVGLNPKFTDTVDLTQMTGILPITKGGTGKTTGKDAANYFLNSLDIGGSTPVDADYYISQYVSGGTTTTTYHRRPMSALWTYIKGKTDTLYVPYNLFDPRASYGTVIASNSNLDADCNAVGTYRSDQASTSQSLTGTVPVTSSGFKIFNIGGYGTKQRQQFLVHNNATDIMYRGSTNIGDSSTWSKWYKIVSLPSGSDNKTFSAVGSSTQPVYVNANGQVIACTSYANASVASAKYLITEGDNRSVATSPNDYTTTGGLPNRIAFRGLKYNTYIGSPSSDVYSYLVGLRGWRDYSGGKAHEIAFNNSGIFIRKGETTTWEDWECFYTSGNLTKTVITNLGIPAQDTTYVFDGTYNASSNKAATVNTVTNAINNLDGNLNNTTPGVGKTLTAFGQTNGKVSATFGNISITKSQVSDFPTSWALSAISGADDLKAIEALTGTTGFLKKTAANTWSLVTFNSGSLNITMDTTDKKKALIKFTAPSFS